jgi:hypothetical protein
MLRWDMSPPGIPWAAILTHGPTLVAAAKRLVETMGTNRVHDRNSTMEARLDQLEKASLDSAQLLQQLAERVEALAAAHVRAARRDRIIIAISVTAAVVAIVALFVAVAR